MFSPPNACKVLITAILAGALSVALVSSEGFEILPLPEEDSLWSRANGLGLIGKRVSLPSQAFNSAPGDLMVNSNEPRLHARGRERLRISDRLSILPGPGWDIGSRQYGISEESTQVVGVQLEFIF